RCKPQLLARLARVDLERNAIGKRMSDELRPHTMLVVEALLEGQQAQDEIDSLADRANTTLAPSPDLRAHVLNRRYAGGLDARRETQIELFRIHADIRRWT